MKKLFIFVLLLTVVSAPLQVAAHSDEMVGTENALAIILESALDGIFLIEVKAIENPIALADKCAVLYRRDMEGNTLDIVPNMTITSVFANRLNRTEGNSLDIVPIA